MYAKRQKSVAISAMTSSVGHESDENDFVLPTAEMVLRLDASSQLVRLSRVSTNVCVTHIDVDVFNRTTIRNYIAMLII